YAVHQSTTTMTSLLSLHDALPIFVLADHLGELIVGTEVGGREGGEGGGVELGSVADGGDELAGAIDQQGAAGVRVAQERQEMLRSEEHTSELQSRGHLVCRLLLAK